MNEFIEVLEKLKNENYLESIDIHFADFLIEKFGGTDKERLLFAIISNSAQKGHTCFYTNLIINFEFYEKYKDTLDKLKYGITSNAIGENKPIIYIENISAYYLQKYYYYEQKIINEINKRTKKIENIDTNKLKELLNKYFPKNDNEIDYQKLSAATATTSLFSLITGGPGTGKTTTVAKILLILCEIYQDLKIKIAAPTGKAAARLQESITSFKTNNKSDFLDLIPNEVTTIHRLLGYIYGKTYFKHNKENQLDADIVVIDEASMIDIALMGKLLDALKEDTIFILLGDKDQLASVAPGSVLSDFCNFDNINSFSSDYSKFLEEITDYKNIEQNQQSNKLLDSIVELKKAYRYKPSSQIAKIAPLINQGKAEESYKIFKENKDDTLKLFNLSEMNEELKNLILNYYSVYLQENDYSKMFEKFNRFRVLCAIRKTDLGVEKLNNYIENLLEKENLINTKKEFYHGKPIMIIENDYRLELFNGDIGLLIEENDEAKVYFPNANGSFRTFSPAILPNFETTYAMTIHKSQGSEFENVAIILPDEPNPVLTRELIYTGVTRAKERVNLFTNENIYIDAVTKKIWRMSGLRFS
jgi:exodeoxyribonuclease V alpha subunit